MKKSEWSDNELEQLLSKMPKIQDHRDPRDIYQSLSLKTKKRKAPVWIFPSVASVAAVLLLFLLAPQVWQGIIQDSETKDENTIALEDDTNKMELTKKIPDEGSNTINGISDDNHEMSMMAQPLETALYEEDLLDQEVITYSIPDQNAQLLIPVSVLVPKDGSSWAERFQSNSQRLMETQWGLAEYFPLNANLSMPDESTINVDVPENHEYGLGSSSETLFISTLQEIMNYHQNINRFTFTTAGKPGIFLSNTGEIVEMNRPAKKQKSYYLYNPKNQNLPFIVPGMTEYTNIEDALGSMTTGDDIYGLNPSIPSDFVYTIDSSTNEILVLTFADTFQLTDEAKNIYAIEAILLTAKEFGFKAVKFENAKIGQIGRFNLESEIKVPVAPNKVIL
jgi:hypothetical protein